MSADLLLAIETSCDETAAALMTREGRVVAQTVRSQVDLFVRYGGVVPEIAGRSHVEHMLPVLQETFEQADATPQDLFAVAVTATPGLVGSLLVGLSAAKALAFACRVPLVPVHHVEAHVYSCFLEVTAPVMPCAGLVASGGHTSLFRVEDPGTMIMRGETRDDAAGEAFDKVAALLGLAYPGGPSIEAAARAGDPTAIRFPRTLLGKTSLEFSFSGLKTAVLYHCRGPKGRDPRPLSEQEVADIAASFQETVVDVLVRKLVRLADQDGLPSLALGGGVAANTRLREKLTEAAAARGGNLYLAPPELTTDNAVMVAGLGLVRYQQGVRAGLDLDARPEGGLPLPLPTPVSSDPGHS